MTRRDQGGTGHGLHIVYSIATNCLGRRPNLDGEPGEGTRIQFIFCRACRRRRRSHRKPKPQATEGARRFLSLL
jgi:hypothetical protein